MTKASWWATLILREAGQSRLTSPSRGSIRAISPISGVESRDCPDWRWKQHIAMPSRPGFQISVLVTGLKSSSLGPRRRIAMSAVIGVYDRARGAPG